MYYEISDFLPIPYRVRFALDRPELRPWMRFQFCTYFHNLDLYEIGYC